MAKRDPVAEAITRVAELKRIDDPAALVAGLVPLLGDKSTYVVSRAADLAVDRSARGALAAMVDAFDRSLRAPTSKDPGAAAKIALARALVKLEAGYEAEDAAALGIRHEHWEAVWGGSAEVAAAVRGHCAILLAAMGSRLALRGAAELLAEPDLKPPRERASWPARADAAKALTMIGSDGAAAVLRFKALLGDPEPAVLSECLAGVIAIEKDDGLTLAERFLSVGSGARTRIEDEPRAEAGLLAIGGSRHPQAFAVLKRHAENFVHSSSRQTFLASVALTRQQAAIDYLIGLVSDGSKDLSTAAAEALEPLRPLPNVGERLDRALAERGR